MPLYNEMFKLSVNDMDLIETALRRTQHALSQEQLVQSDEGKGDHVETIRQIRVATSPPVSHIDHPARSHP